MTTRPIPTERTAPSLAPERQRRAWLRATLLFAFTIAGGLTMAAGIAPRLEGFDRLVVLAVGSGLFAAGTAFFLVIGFLLELRGA